MIYSETWDLDALFEGGVTGVPFKNTIENLKLRQNDLIGKMESIDFSENDASIQLAQLICEMATFEAEVTEAGTFANMSADSDMSDENAMVARNQVQVMQKPYENANNRLNKKLAALSETAWQDLISKSADLQAISFKLEERRRDAKRLLNDETEALLSQLNSDGLEAWSEIYATSSSVIKINVVLSDGPHEFSVGQAMNYMYASPNAADRAAIFAAWEAAFSQYGPIFADILNHLAGYRLTTQNAHQYHDYLEEPLEYNRMQSETLSAMWQAVENGKEIFLDFLKCKQELLGLEQLHWQDVDAPLTFTNTENKKFTYDEACAFIIKHFASFGPKMAEFAKNALENRWVEAENRSGKRPGGYCTELPVSKESRIFMTFTGSASDVSTLAHELGHAFHSDVLKEEPRWNQEYAMNVAETASTFGETLINNANLASAANVKERLQLLNAKLENASAMFLNIRARFLFEKSFYEERQKTYVSETRLNELMVAAQKEAFGHILQDYHPHFWASKLHFFIDDVPFYNFPYTFGYLFSLGIYAEYLKSPEGFEDKYIALLQNTGKMTVEDLAMKHLNVDLTKPDFWQAGVDLAAQDAAAFIAESNALVEIGS